MPNFDLVIKGGHVIDAANNVDSLMDVGVAGRGVGAVEPNIPESQGRRVIDATGMWVTPGLIDIHAHCTGSSVAMFLSSVPTVLSSERNCSMFSLISLVKKSYTGLTLAF